MAHVSVEIVKSLTCLRLPARPLHQFYFNVRLGATGSGLELFLTLLVILLWLFVEAEVEGLEVLIRRHVDLQIQHVVLALVLLEAKLDISYHFLLLVIDLQYFLSQPLIAHGYPHSAGWRIQLLLSERGGYRRGDHLRVGVGRA